MKMTEEIDALRTIGVGQLELLVLPKALALVLALSLLIVYIDVMGVVAANRALERVLAEHTDFCVVATAKR